MVTTAQLRFVCLVALLSLLLASPAASAPNATEYWRPVLHYSPRVNWINDPNGLVYDPSTKMYHLFSQYAAEVGSIDTHTRTHVLW